MPRFALDIDSVPRPVRSQALLDAVNQRVVIADGAMGTMLQDRELSLEADFQNLEGCNEILNDTRPDIIGDIHDAYFATGIDAVETNTFGANWSNLSDYGIDDRIEELARKGAEIARDRAEAAEKADGRMRWVLGSMGPGTKLPSLGHTSYGYLKQTFAAAGRGPHRRGSGCLPHRDQPGPPADQSRGQRLQAGDRGPRRPASHLRRGDRRDHRNHADGPEIGAALTALEPLGVDAIGLNCATGPDEMSEHLRHLSKQSSVAIACMPNAGLPVLTANGAHYPLSPSELATSHEQFVREFGLGLVGGCCGTTPEHMAAVVERLAPFRTAPRSPPAGGAPTAAAFPPSAKQASLPSTIT